MKNKIAILFVLCIFSTTAFSQKDIELDNIKTKHFIGLHAGNTTGFGFSYRYWPTKLGCQIGGYPIWHPQNAGFRGAKSGAPDLTPLFLTKLGGSETLIQGAPQSKFRYKNVWFLCSRNASPAPNVPDSGPKCV